MRRQSRALASHVPLMVLWKKPQVTTLLVQRVCMSVQLLLPLARDCTVVDLQQMRAWWERLWHYLRTQKKLRLHAYADKEHTVTLHALLNLACTGLNVLRCPLRGLLQGEATLCRR